MRPLFVVVVLCVPAVAVSVTDEEGASGDQQPRLTVSRSVESPTAGIQEAIDSLGRGGGVVTLPVGEYRLRQTIHLRSNVTIQGAGPTTVLRKPKSAETRLAAVAEQGRTSVRVKNPKGFAAGDQVAIRDRDAQGWNVVQAIIKGIEGNELLMDRAMPRTCDPAKGGFVVHAFPAFDANEASRIVIKDLAIRDDNARDLSVHGQLDLKNPRSKWVFIVPFPVAAISLVGCTDSRVEGVTVAGWLSDGVSLQRGANNTVVKCLAENCGGNGFHPGGWLHDSVFSHNVARGNYYDGLYFCAGVECVTVHDSEFVGNNGNGIGGLGDSGDKYNTVANNVCAENGGHGIEMADGEHNTVTGNTCRSNSRSVPRTCSGIWLKKTSLSVVKGNRCFDDQKTKTQKHGIEESADCRENIIRDNDCRSNAQADLVLAAEQPQPATVGESTERRRSRSAGPAPSSDRLRGGRSPAEAPGATQRQPAERPRL